MAKANNKNRTALKLVQKFHPNVRRVIDATKSIDVLVTAKDCKSASSKMADECAVAKALQRNHSGAIVSVSTTYVIDGEKATRYKTPNAISKEIVSFDRSHVFEPGEYSLRAPSKCEQ